MISSEVCAETSTIILQRVTREHIEVEIADFDEIWYECSFQKNIRSVFSFIGNGRCARGENYPRSCGCETYFVKYLAKY